MAQAVKQGQPQSPELEAQVRDEVVLREMFQQEAEKRGLAASAEYKSQMEFARQSILIRELFADYQKKNPVSDADTRAEYEKFKAQSAGTEVRARHILVEKEDEAKALITQIKGGMSFEELAKKNSKDPGSGANGGDLDFANPNSYVPEFSQALLKLKKGEMTETPVKSQFGYHIIRYEDSRPAQFPEYDAGEGRRSSSASSSRSWRSSATRSRPSRRPTTSSVSDVGPPVAALLPPRGAAQLTGRAGSARVARWNGVGACGASPATLLARPGGRLRCGAGGRSGWRWRGRG